LKTSQIRSEIEDLIPTYNILVILLHSNLVLKSVLTDGFSIRFNSWKWLFYWTTLYKAGIEYITVDIFTNILLIFIH